MKHEVARTRQSGKDTGFYGTAVLSVVFLLVYAMSLSNHLTGDSTWYAHDIMWPGEQFWHPHHLFYNPLMRLLLLPFAAMLGSPEMKMLFLQWVNLAINAVASAAFYLVARRMGARIVEAAVFTFLLGLSGASWFFSSQIEVYGLTSLFLCVAMLGVIARGDDSRDRLTTAAGLAGALFFHQTAIFMIPPMLAYELASRRRERGRAAVGLGLSYLLPLAVVGLTYVVVGLSLGDRDTGSMWRWLTLHVQFGFWGKGDLTAGTLQPAFQRCMKAVLSAGTGSAWLQLLFGALGVYALARVLAAGRRAVRDPALFAALLSWTALLAGFSTWWDATGAEFWGMVLMPFYLAFSLLAPGAADRSSRSPLPLRLAAAAALACCLAPVALSSVVFHRWNQRPNDIRQAARAAPAAALDGDLILASGTDRSVYYRIYLDGRPVNVLAINVKPAREAGARSTPSTFTAALVDTMAAEVRDTASRGGRCLVDHWIVEGTFTTTRLTSHLVPDEFVATLRQRFRILPVGDAPDALFYELRLPG